GESNAVLPANYTFTARDADSHPSRRSSDTAGTQSLRATDTVTATITGTASGLTVGPAAASVLVVGGFPSPSTAGTAGTVTVTAKDAYGNMATGYLGTVHVTSSEDRKSVVEGKSVEGGGGRSRAVKGTLNDGGN